MSKYYWDDYTIRERKFEMERRMLNGDNTFTHKQWEEIIHDLEEIIECFDYNVEHFIDFKSAVAKNKSFLEKYGVATDLITDFFYDMYPVDVSCGKLCKRKYSKQKIVTFMRDTYKSMGEVFFTPFESILSHFTHNHRFFKYGEPYAREGSMMPVRHLNEVYSVSLMSATLTDIITPIHEVGHGIEFLLNPEGFLVNPNEVVSEIVPTFFEFIAGERLVKEFGLGKEVRKYFIWTLSDAVNDAYDATYMYDALEIVESCKNKTNRQIIQEVAKRLHLGRGLAKKLVTCNEIEEDYKYSFAFMVALELYMIYRCSKKDALDILRRLIECNDYPMEDYLELLEKYDCLPGKRRDDFKKLLLK